MNKQTMVKVLRVTREAEGITTLRFAWNGSIAPGQFLMVWLPGEEEIPMSASYIYGEKGITIKEVGRTTKALCSLRAGDIIGIRGPYGKGFQIPFGKVLLVGGGSGMASLMTVADFIGDAEKVDILIGARTASELIFVERARNSSHRVEVSTDDGSVGYKGTVVDLAAAHLSKIDYDAVMGCGPEKMLVALLRLCEEKGIPCQLSLERYMKCGVGLCGSCALDGLRVCAEGPVFDGKTLLNSLEFGKYRRDECGRQIRL
ncbi:MAG: dihydroorotate dehydrogenase electron transfer subunit [Methanomassiliicoccales archaeon]